MKKIFARLCDLRGRIFIALAILILIALTTSQTVRPASAQSGEG